MKKLLQYIASLLPLFILSAIVFSIVSYLKNGHLNLDIEFFVGIISTMAVAYFSLDYIHKRKK